MTRYAVDPASSWLRVEAASTLHALRVDAPGVTGLIEAASDRIVGGDIEVRIDRLHGGLPLVDRAARQRLDLGRHPSIRAVLQSSTGSGPWTCAGTVTFQGRTVPVSGSLTGEIRDEGLRLTGTSRFDVRDWGVAPPRLLMLRVEPVIVVTIELVATRDGTS